MIVPVFVLGLAACGGNHRPSDNDRTAEPARPAIEDRSKPLREPESPLRTVVHGDTLYSIAWESGRDFREVAKWNRISSPYTIKPGQQIRLTPPAETEKSASAPAATETPAPKKKAPAAPSSAGSKPTTKNTNAGTSKPVAAAPAKAAPPTSKTGGSTASNKKPAPTAALKSGDWAWPADGQILNRYSETDLKGLDITGPKGSGVRAAAGGRVVYQGSGLRGYGQLIIIKHNDEFLSAYAHNDRIYVKEGDVVTRGQKIADMGSTGTDRVKLHFEIRRQGVPVDPQKYLPKR